MNATGPKKVYIGIMFLFLENILPAAIMIYGSETNSFKDGGSTSCCFTPGCKTNNCKPDGKKKTKWLVLFR